MTMRFSTRHWRSVEPPFLKRCAPLVGSSRRTLKRLYVRTSKKAHALTPMSKAPLVRLLPLRIRSGTQPQRGVGGLHRLRNHPYQIVAEGFQVNLVPQLLREGFQRLPRVILPPVEAPVYERLDAASQR